MEFSCSSYCGYGSSCHACTGGIHGAPVIQESSSEAGPFLSWETKLEEPGLAHTANTSQSGPGVEVSHPSPCASTTLHTDARVCFVPLHSALWVCPWELSLAPIRVLLAQLTASVFIEIMVSVSGDEDTHG